MLADYVIPLDLQGSVGKLEDALSPFVTPERLVRLRQVAARRSRRVLCVFESTNHSHNISAVLRTIDGFGFQDLFFVYLEMQNTRFRVSDSVERGSSDWLLARRGSDVKSCASYLKAAGYKIALVSLPTFYRTGETYRTTLPHFSCDQFGNDEFLELLSNNRIALVFGNEKMGVDARWTEEADLYVSVGMRGFVESLNVSVCAGILLHELRMQVETLVSRGHELLVTTAEQRLLVESWLAKDVTQASEILKRVDPNLATYLAFLRQGNFYRPNI